MVLCLKIDSTLSWSMFLIPPLQVFVNGMFAFVLYDSGRDEFFVARDPVSFCIVIIDIMISAYHQQIFPNLSLADHCSNHDHCSSSGWNNSLIHRLRWWRDHLVLLRVERPPKALRPYWGEATFTSTAQCFKPIITIVNQSYVKASSQPRCSPLVTTCLVAPSQKAQLQSQSGLT